MARLENKSILVVIPKDYYDEEMLDPILDILKAEEPKYLNIASCKFKEAVGMRTGRINPNVLIVDAMEGVTGDSYVTSQKGTRQILAVYQGIVLIGGKGARKYLWDDKILKVLINDRFRAGAAVAAIGSAIPTLAKAGVLETVEVAYDPEDKKGLALLEPTNAILSEDDLVVDGNVITAKNAASAEALANTLIDVVEKIDLKK